MKKIIVIILIVGVAIGLYILLSNREEPLPAPAGTSTQNRMMSIENYVKIYISELSPIPEVVGGRFYVTDIKAENGEGTVSYEDGHNAYTADFTYTIEENGAVRIDSFTIKE